MLQNCRPVSLLPICRKVFQGLICNEMFEFFMNSALISEDQLEFTSGDSCVNQIEIIRFSCSGSQDSLS